MVRIGLETRLRSKWISFLVRSKWRHRMKVYSLFIHSNRLISDRAHRNEINRNKVCHKMIHELSSLFKISDICCIYLYEIVYSGYSSFFQWANAPNRRMNVGLGVRKRIMCENCDYIFRAHIYLVSFAISPPAIDSLNQQTNWAYFRFLWSTLH